MPKGHSDLALSTAQRTTIPNVPFRTPMFGADGNMTRTWILFFEQLGGAFTQIFNGGGAGLWGGVNIQTSSYAAQATDDGLLIVFATTAAATFQLPSKPPSTVWKIFVQNAGTAAVTLLPNGAPLLDGAVPGGALQPGQGVYISTDGTNYYTERGLGAAGIALETNGTPNGVQTLLNLVAGANVTLTDDGAGDVTIAATGGTLTPPVTLAASIPQPILTLTQTGLGDALLVNASSAASYGIEVTGSPATALLKLTGGVQAAIRVDNSTVPGSEGIIVQTDDVTAIAATSNSLFGVFGTSTSGVGVRGTSGTNDGVQGISTSGNGVTALSSAGVGLAATVFGSSPAIYARAAGAGAAIQIVGIAFALLPTVAAGHLQYCTDAKNVVDDLALPGSVAVGGGHGSMLAFINGSWRIMC